MNLLTEKANRLARHPNSPQSYLSPIQRFFRYIFYFFDDQKGVALIIQSFGGEVRDLCVASRIPSGVPTLLLDSNLPPQTSSALNDVEDFT
ncbi:MAG: hypothetical protein ACKVQS_11645 [Fimbriimonadaceae bacterium]